MRAARYESYGGPEVIHVEDIETPTPADDELLVRVGAATVNRTDCAILAAHPFFMRLFTGLVVPKKRTLGTDFAGRVDAVGVRVTKYAVGDRVWGFEELGAGSHAEHLVIAEGGALARMPAEIDFKDGAACMEGAFYAWSYLNKVKVFHESRVMINGATGAIGSVPTRWPSPFRPCRAPTRWPSASRLAMPSSSRDGNTLPNPDVVFEYSEE